MKEIFQAINEYPWTTFFVWIIILYILIIISAIVSKK